MNTKLQTAANRASKVALVFHASSFFPCGKSPPTSPPKRIFGMETSLFHRKTGVISGIGSVFVKSIQSF
jgi:hypothetical protein